MKKVAFYGIFALLCYLFIETGLRVFHYFHPVPLLFDTSYNRYRGRPHSDSFGYRLNALGFKDKEFTAKKPGTWRIVGIGDSFTFGPSPYPLNFLTLTEDLLNKNRPASPVEIFNMGIVSTGPPQQLTLLTKEGLQWNPDMVLLNFFIGNDIQESLRSDKKKWMQTYSYTGTMLYSLYRVFTKLNKDFQWNYFGSNQQYCDTCISMQPNAYVQLQESRSFIFQKNNPHFETTITDAIYYLKAFKELCDKHGIKFVVALLPDESQVNAGLRRQVIASLHRKDPHIEWDNLQPNRRLNAALQREGIPCLDLTPYFIANASPATYLCRDTHWNARGNRLAAEFLSQNLPQYIPASRESRAPP